MQSNSENNSIKETIELQPTFPSTSSTSSQKQNESHSPKSKATTLVVTPTSTPALPSSSSSSSPTSKLSDQEKMIPFATANPLSKLLYSWQTPFMRLGFKRPLQSSDLFQLPTHLEAKYNGELIEHYWKLETEKVRSRISKSSSSSSSSDSNKKPNVNASDSNATPSDTSSSNAKTPVPSLVNVLWKVYGMEWMLGGFFQLISVTTPMISPYFLKWLLDYLQLIYDAKKNNTPLTNPPSIGQGIGYIIAIFALQFTSTLANSLFFTICMKLGMQIRSGLVMAMYRKSLTLSFKARSEEFNPGKVTNMIATDTVRIDTVTPYVHMLWSSPLQIIVVLGLLLHLLGPSALAGFAVMVIFVPFQGFIMKVLSKYRKQVQAVTDQRMKSILEVLQGIKIIKFFTWEHSFLNHILKVREKELKFVRNLTIWRSAINALSQVIPALTALVVFSVYSSSGNTLTAAIVFASSSYFNLLRLPLMFLPMMLAFTVDAKVALNRVASLLSAEELDAQPLYLPMEKELPAIEVSQAAFQWISNQPLLTNISFQIPQGSLVAIVGRVGEGKSSLLSGIVGEMKRTQGEVKIRGRLSYCPQQPWIQNATVRDNILFGLPFDKVKYERAIHLACLERDLDQLPDGELTEIGEKGINLSGGQKARINLARAIYYDADIVLLDDPLSAVDAHVGAFLFHQTFQKALKGKTRVLATHALHYAAQCDYIIFMKECSVKEVGTYQELMENKESEFAQQMRHFGLSQNNKNNNEATEERGQSEVDEGKKEKIEDSNKDTFKNLTTLSSETKDNHDATSPSSENKVTSQADPIKEKEVELKPVSPTTPLSSSKNEPPKRIPQKLMKEEERLTGKVELSVYFTYFRAAGGLFILALIAFVLILGQLFRLGMELWLAAWTNQKFALSLTVYLGVYFAWGFAQALTFILNGIQIAYTGVVASKNMHQKALISVLHAPMSFFDTTPLGRILNRFSKDVDTLDNTITDAIRMFMTTLATCVSTLGLIIGVTPYFAIPMLPLLGIYYFLQKFYRATSRELKRLDSISRSPLFAQFSETLNGIVTIRAYGEQARFSLVNQRFINENNRPFFLQLCAQRWLAIRIETIGACLIFFSGLFGVLTQGNLEPELIGLSLSNALQVTGVLNWCVRQAAETEVQMNSVERIEYYMNELPKEAPMVLPKDSTLDSNVGTTTTTTLPTTAPSSTSTPTSSWPSQGEIQFKNVVLSYRPGLPPVLKHVNLHILPGEKVGVVGRTGAGKSSLIAALFRLVEVSEGEILLDGVVIQQLGLKLLRSKLGIIPQDPVLFSGTIRSNLDRFQEYSDTECWLNLERAGLKPYVQQLPLKLDSVVTENGDNLSVGQRQLVCLARAMLRKTKVLVLDEVTASVDAQTDTQIQHAIRSELKGCTILTIAHRLNTIMDYDKIVVMGEGQVLEHGTPLELIQQPHSLFNQLIDETGPSNAQMLRSLVLSSSSSSSS